MQTVLDSISELLEKPWDDHGAVDPTDVRTIMYVDGAIAWEISYSISRRLLWIAGRTPPRFVPLVVDLQMFCEFARSSSSAMSAKTVILRPLGDSNDRYATTLARWPDGRLEVNICVGREPEAMGC